ncbi:MAG: hypothetical protein JO015_10150 [Verrucomicrobia bacterium]|nr:hypothetical protein [Verrucomicrobiota bacterium]
MNSTQDNLELKSEPAYAPPIEKPSRLKLNFCPAGQSGKIGAAAARWIRALPVFLQISAAASAFGQVAPVPCSDMLPDLTRWLARQTRGDEHSTPVAGTGLAGFLRQERPDIYGHSALFLMDAPSLSRYLAELAPYLPAMRTLEGRCLDQEPKITEALRRLFPDFDPSRVRVSLMLSLFRFDAKIPHDQPNQLWLGLDGIAKLHGPNGRLGVLLAHENFHLYHFQVNPQPHRGESVPLYRQVWQEGLACYISHLLNPGASMADVLLDPDLAANGPRYVSTVARAMLNDLEADDDAVTARYLSYHRAMGALPPRMGYLIGYDVAAACAARTPLSELVRLRGNGLRRIVQRAVRTLSR